MALIFQAKGLAGRTRSGAARALMRDKQAASTRWRARSRYRSRQMGGNPWTAAGFSFPCSPSERSSGAAVPADDRDGGDRGEHRGR